MHDYIVYPMPSLPWLQPSVLEGLVTRKGEERYTPVNSPIYRSDDTPPEAKAIARFTNDEWFWLQLLRLSQLMNLAALRGQLRKPHEQAEKDYRAAKAAADSIARGELKHEL